MLVLLHEDFPSRRWIRSQQHICGGLPRQRNECRGSTDDIYATVGDQECFKKINEDVEILERKYTSAQYKEQEHLESRAHEESSIEKKVLRNIRVGETDRSNKSKQNNSGSKTHQDIRRRNTEGNRDGATKASEERNENQF